MRRRLAAPPGTLPSTATPPAAATLPAATPPTATSPAATPRCPQSPSRLPRCHPIRCAAFCRDNPPALPVPHDGARHNTGPRNAARRNINHRDAARRAAACVASPVAPSAMQPGRGGAAPIFWPSPGFDGNGAEERRSPRLSRVATAVLRTRSSRAARSLASGARPAAPIPARCGAPRLQRQLFDPTSTGAVFGAGAARGRGRG